MTNIVNINKLSKSFLHRNKLISVLDELELQVDEGEMCAVVGASGVGKSTFLNVLGTLDKPSSGHIKINGEDITRLGPAGLAKFRNKTIGFVFQFHYLLPEFTALENVMMPGLIQKQPRSKIKEAAMAMLEEVGLSHRLTHRPGELSGGEQQRVALARALVLRPPLLLADEPTGNLDSKTAAGIHELFFKINKSYNTTMLMVTHNEDMAASMPRTLTLAEGKIHES
jgi:lipoprotein-releasing system ATP-binding protein